MANTGVLPFVRGVDFTQNNFSDNNFPEAVSLMTGVQWLKLDATNLKEIPKEMGNLTKLESLSLKKNHIEKLFGELTELICLRTLNLRYNNIKCSGIPKELFNLDELNTLDLSHNNLKEIPDGLINAKSLLVLNLSHNSINAIPTNLFINLNDLLFLDLSYNQLETLPPQIRRLINLQTLILNYNPMGHFQLRQLPSLINLETLHMRHTERNLTNFPTTNLENLLNLQDLDLSENQLIKIPDSIFSLINLKRLNLSDNQITTISTSIEFLEKLEILNLSHNSINLIPNSICKLINLRHLYLNDNNIDFDGIPSGIGKLSLLEIFSASHNRLEMIPEGLCRCGSLKKLLLNSNCLITLPDAIHLLQDLIKLDLRDNPDLIMPPKPIDILNNGSGLEFYNIDFSLQNQLRLAGANVTIPTPAQNSTKDSIARKLRLRRGKRDYEEADQDQAKILKGMKDVAREKNRNIQTDVETESLKPKRWEESLEKPPLDYSEFFEEDAGQIPGLTIWEIENFLPNRIDEVAYGKFYEGDCYIILKTLLDENKSFDWKIYFWIGEKASLDKKACSAIHAVNLRNYLGAQCRTIREEQGDESEEFLNLFNTPITYIEGGRTCSGFYTVEDNIFDTRFYRIHSSGPKIHLEPIPITYKSLDPRYVFILDTGLKIFIWNGKNAKNTIKSKTRLMCEKINKNERKNRSDIITIQTGLEDLEFWKLLDWEMDNKLYEPVEHVNAEFVPIQPRLYQVQLGMGYLELPQVELSHGKLIHTLLKSKNVYILDCYLDLFVWIGKKSTRLVNAAAIKLSEELFNMIARPDYAMITRVREGTESQLFKSKFSDWDEVIAVDFTRTAESVQKTGADLTRWAKLQQTKADLTALFTPRQPSMSSIEAQQLMDEWNEDLEAMDAFVLEGKKFVRLPEEELGHFYSMDCYVFSCRYWIPPNDDGDGVDDNNLTNDGDDLQRVVYFWQGRDTSNMGWLTFTFTLQKNFKALFQDKLEVVRTHQQQENMKFMAHFRRKFIIHQGKRKQKIKNQVEFYHLRSNGSALYTRLVQIKPDPSYLNSAFCYILNVPFEQEDNSNSGIVYVWIGSKSDPDEARLIQEIAEEMFNNPWVSLQILNEGDEPENFFWVGLGGKKPYDLNADFMNYTRLFRCSNEKGYFIVSEKCTDFCQDDLADDDIMILDNGEQVFLWLGMKCSEVEIKLAYKSAQVYIQHMRVKQPDRQRKLFLTLKNKESRRFYKCFHGWGEHKKSLE